jgi:transcriptional regulator with XRE-family HTH domain
MTDYQAKQLGALLRRARQRRGLSRLALSALTGFGDSWLLRLEQGHYTNPDPVHLARLAEVLSVDPVTIDRVSRDHLADSLPSTRTYLRSKHKLSPEATDEMEAALADIVARDARRREQAGARS